MKKIISLGILAIISLATLVGCGEGENTITVVSREDGSGTRGAFVELTGVLESNSDGNSSDKTYEEAIIANKTDSVIATVKQDENAIGYISLGSLNDEVKTVKINGVEVTAENILKGSYEIARPFNIATKGDLTYETMDFISFIMSKQGQGIISESYVPVNLNGEEYVNSGATGKITIGGSTSVAPIMEKLREEYIKINPSVEIEIQSLGSTAGMTGAIEGTFDIGMASRDLRDSELGELNGLVIASDGIAVILNSSNSIDSITTEELRMIYTGEITSWGDIKK